ncbi:MAG: mltG [Clostridiales bacterium]|jgi:UPF0755 protein|nr:mltG [Clostridiales bacterium]
MKKSQRFVLELSKNVGRILFIITTVTVLILVGAWAYKFGYRIMEEKVKVVDVIKEYEVDIPKGAPLKQIAKLLKEQDLIESEFIFTVKVRLSEYNGKFRYGKYNILNNMSEEDIMQLLATEGEKRSTVRITIPEGLTIAEIGAIFEEKGLFTADEFIQATEEGTFSYKILNTLVTDNDRKFRLQGYLSPNTYDFFEESTATEVVEKLTSETDSFWTDESYEKAKNSGYSVDEIMIIASLIEKEGTSDAEDRANIAGVIYNRLKAGMILQIDASVVYAYALNGEKIAENGQVLFEHLEIDSPYNTYKYSGLPIGPVTNPGKTAINAALNPIQHDYYYYVYNPATGKHEFNKTLEEHNNAINRIRG